jgi:homoserine O-succinyltransferase
MQPSALDLPAPRPRPAGIPERLTVGLLNNMPDAALAATERQFERLLGPGVRLLRFHLPEIVTGCEPRAASLPDEPYWPALTRAIDWAAEHTVSTLFSCLAAHAAVLHRDGIARRRLPAKRSGVFACRATGRHPLLAGLPDPLPVPHSRYNDLPEADLAAAGYAVLTRSEEAGVDLFVKPGPSLLVFLQGHPEYDPDSLAREYRRDLLRYRDGERADRPHPPAHYFDPEVAARLAGVAGRLAPGGQEDPPPCPAPARAPWPEAAAGLFANWLALVGARRGRLTRTGALAAS